MVGLATIATLLVAALASLFMAWTIGAGSSGSTPFAPAVGANAISVLRAALIVGVLGFLGAVLQGAGISQTVGTNLVRLPGGGGLPALGATVALLVAAALVAAGIFRGYPIATAFTVTGAVVGAGLAAGGAPVWPQYLRIAAMWVAMPFVGAAIAYGTARTLRSERVSERVAVPALAAVVALALVHIRFVLLAPGTDQASVAVAVARAAGGGIAPVAGVSVLAPLVAGLALWAYMGLDEKRGQRHFLLALGGLVAFSAGGSQVGLAIGPLLPLVGDGAVVQVGTTLLLAAGGLGLLVGSWTGAPRMIKALSQDYSSLGPRRSIAALIAAFGLAQAAVFLKVPVSFNEIIIFSIVGSGAAAGGSAVSPEKIGKTVLAWIASLAGSLGVSYVAYSAVVAVA